MPGIAPMSMPPTVPMSIINIVMGWKVSMKPDSISCMLFSS
jgi:hypothetical protein